jgi:hypothetical protein
MNEQQRLDFLAAFGDEFCDGWEGLTNLVPQDAYEVFLRVFRQEPSPQLLRSLSDGQLEQFRVGAERYLEREGLTIEQIRGIIFRTLSRHPPNNP